MGIISLIIGFFEAVGEDITWAICFIWAIKHGRQAVIRIIWIANASTGIEEIVFGRVEILAGAEIIQIDFILRTEWKELIAFIFKELPVETMICDAFLKLTGMRLFESFSPNQVIILDT